MIKEGWLTKCGGSHKSWKRRWFILQENLLYYFADKKVRHRLPGNRILRKLLFLSFPRYFLLRKLLLVLICTR